MSIKEALATATKGFPVPKTTFTIQKVYPRKEGESSYGPWSLQNANTAEGVTLSFDKMPDQSYLQGKTITIESGMFKGSPAGFKFDVYTDKQGKEQRKIKVTRAATITVDGQQASGPIPVPALGSATTAQPAEAIESMVRRIVREELDKLSKEAERIDGAHKADDEDGMPF